MLYIFTWWPRWFVWLPECPPPMPWWWWYDDITSCLSWVRGPGDPVDPGPSDPLPWPPPLPLPGPGDWWLWWWWCLPMSTAARTSALLSRPSLRPPNKSPYGKKFIKINFMRLKSRLFNFKECNYLLLGRGNNSSNAYFFDIENAKMTVNNFSYLNINEESPSLVLNGYVFSLFVE